MIKQNKGSIINTQCLELFSTLQCQAAYDSLKAVAKMLTKSLASFEDVKSIK